MTNILVKRSNDNIIFQDADFVLTPENIEVGEDGNIKFYFAGENDESVDVYQLDEPIPDWIGCKFLYQNGEIVLNPDCTS